MHFFFSAGEPSGDLHGGNLICQLRQRHPQATFSGFGGPKMASSGCEILYDLTTLAVMFFDRILANYQQFRRLLRQADQFFSKRQVDAVVLIDFPGFNWWVARAAKKHKIPVIYYGAPQLWAWAPWRIAKLKRFVDLVLCKLPFEPEWFQRRGVNAQFIGHPYFDETSQVKVDEAFIQQWSREPAPTLLLLPGSRDREVEHHWPILREVALRCQQSLPTLRIAVGCYRPKHLEMISRDISLRKLTISPFVNRTPELMHVATACLACSGSVSLELMERRVPTVIVYKLDLVKQLLKWLLLRCRYITLVNLIAADHIERLPGACYDPDRDGAEQVPMPEYLLTRDRTAAISHRLLRMLTDGAERQRYVTWLDRLAVQHARPGASRKAAGIISHWLRQRRRLGASHAA